MHPSAASRDQHKVLAGFAIAGMLALASAPDRPFDDAPLDPTALPGSAPPPGVIVVVDAGPKRKPNVARQHFTRWVGATGVFAGAGMAIAFYRLALHGCYNYECQDDRFEDTLDAGTAQGISNLHAIAFAGAAGGMIGRCAEDHAMKRQRLKIGGGIMLALGTVMGIGMRSAIGYTPEDWRDLDHLWRADILVTETGAIFAMFGSGLLARGVAGERVRRRRAVALAPSLGPTSIGLAGRF
jgi:hypothetical protein